MALMLDRRRLLICLAVAPIAVSARSPTGLRALIDRNDAARGGAVRLRRLRSMNAVVRITEPKSLLIGHYRAERSGHMRIDVFASGKRVFSEGLDGEGAWQWPGDASSPKPVGDAGRQALEHGVVFNLVPLSSLARLGHRLTLISADPPCAQLDFADGFSSRLFFDPVSGHVVRRQDRRAYHPDVDPTVKRIETRFSDFRRQNGIVSPWLHEDIDLVSGDRIGLTETLRLAWDTPVAKALPRTAAIEPPLDITRDDPKTPA